MQNKFLTIKIKARTLFKKAMQTLRLIRAVVLTIKIILIVNLTKTLHFTIASQAAR